MELPVATPEPLAGAVVDVVVPVYNEEAVLESSVRRLHEYVETELPFPTAITIVDSDSTDRTWEIAQRLERALPAVAAIRLPRSGKGLALRTAWSRSTAPVLAYMDADLSADLTGLMPLLAPLLSGHSDIAIGTRLSRTSRVARGPKRELISRCYNLLLRMLLRVGFSDAQCGFKAIRKDRAEQLLPLVEDDRWFFDAELLVLAERAGMRIYEVPIDWVDDPESRVNLLEASIVDAKGILRLGRGLATGSIRLPDVAGDPSGLGKDPLGASGGGVRYAMAGLASSVVHVLIYLALRAFAVPQVANLISFLSTEFVVTPAHSRFGVRRADPSALRPGLLFLVLGLVTTAGSLAVVGTVAPDASRAWEAFALVASRGVAAVTAFLLTRRGAVRAVSERQREVV